MTDVLPQSAPAEASPLRVLLATDDSPSARCAESWVLRLRRAPPPAVEVVSVAGYGIARFGWAMRAYRTEVRDAVEEVREAERLRAEGIANAVADRLQADGLRTYAWVRQGSVVDELLELVDAHRPDLIVVGPRGQSLLSELVMGSVTQQLVAHAPCPVLVARPPRTADGPLPGRAVVLVHHADSDAAAVRWLARTGWLERADTLVVGLRDRPVERDLDASVRELDERVRADVDAALRRVVEPLVDHTAAIAFELGSGHPVEDAISAAARHDADVVIVSRPAPRRPRRPLAEEVSRNARCSVLVIPVH